MKTFFMFALALILSVNLLQYSFAQERRAWDQPKKITVDSLNATTAIISLRFDTATLSDTIFSPLFGTFIQKRTGRALMRVCYQLSLDSTFRQIVSSNGIASSNGDFSCGGTNTSVLLIPNRPLPPSNTHIDSALLIHFAIIDVRPNTTYFCRARAWSARMGWDYLLDSFYSDTLRFTTPLGTSVREQPQMIAFASTAPNPASDVVQLSWQQKHTGRVEVMLVDMLGRVVQTHSLGVLAAGEQRSTLSVAELPTGIYALRLEANGQVTMKQVVVRR
jgi:hypothetical protein